MSFPCFFLDFPRKKCQKKPVTRGRWAYDLAPELWGRVAARLGPRQPLGEHNGMETMGIHGFYGRFHGI
jgi:hypothetical protein